MRRPRLPLSLFNPRRRLRDRLLATMLVVALVPAAAFFVLTAVSLHGITQTTVNHADSELVQNQEQGFQKDLGATANGAVEANLQALRQTVGGLAGQLSAQSGSTSASPSASASATPSPSAGATASPSAAATPSAPAAPGGAAGAPQAQPLGDGVDAISFPDSSATAELLVGVPTGSTAPVLTRAGRLAALSKFATASLVKAAAKEGEFVDALWVMDPADQAVWVSPGGVSPPPQGDSLAANPQGIPLSLLRLSTAPASQPTASWSWTIPYQNPLHGGDWEVTVYALDGHGLVVGADVPLAQFAKVIPQAPAQAGSYPLLLDNDTDQVIAVNGLPAADAKDFTAPLIEGKALPPPAGNQGRTVLANLEQAEAAVGDGAAVAPIEGSVRGVKRLYFVAAVTDPGWTLVELGAAGELPAQRLGAPGGHQHGADQRLPGCHLDRRHPAAGVLPPRHPAIALRGRAGPRAHGLGGAARRGPHR